MFAGKSPSINISDLNYLFYLIISYSLIDKGYSRILIAAFNFSRF